MVWEDADAVVGQGLDVWSCLGALNFDCEADNRQYATPNALNVAGK